jgi:curli biogenesis system outer membrane secretion channel CsgG
VTLTARMIDATTGEVLISAKGEGLSTKGGGLAVGGAGGGGGAGFAMGTSNYKDSAIGDAQEQATQKLVAMLIARKDRLEE